jgi:hypothetical protein
MVLDIVSIRGLGQGRRDSMTLFRVEAVKSPYPVLEPIQPGALLASEARNLETKLASLIDRNFT